MDESDDLREKHMGLLDELRDADGVVEWDGTGRNGAPVVTAGRAAPVAMESREGVTGALVELVLADPGLRPDATS